MSLPAENFDELRRMMALKRHEAPPPGYFDHFPDKVIARIEAEGLSVQPSWWRRMFPDLDAKPLLVCAYGMVIVGLLVVGLGASQTFEPQPATLSAAGNPWFPATPVPDAAVLAPAQVEMHPWITRTDSASSFSPAASSTAPSYLFDPNFWSEYSKAPPKAARYPLR